MSLGPGVTERWPVIYACTKRVPLFSRCCSDLRYSRYLYTVHRNKDRALIRFVTQSPFVTSPVIIVTRQILHGDQNWDERVMGLL